MQVNWEQMPTEEIQKLIADAQAVLHQREEQERQKVLEEMKKLAASVGVSFRLTSGKGKKAKRQSSEKTPPKATRPPQISEPGDPGRDMDGQRTQTAVHQISRRAGREHRKVPRRSGGMTGGVFIPSRLDFPRLRGRFSEQLLRL